MSLHDDAEPLDRSMGWKWINETTRRWWQGNQWSETYDRHPSIPTELIGLDVDEEGQLIGTFKVPEEYKHIFEHNIPMSTLSLDDEASKDGNA